MRVQMQNVPVSLEVGRHTAADLLCSFPAVFLTRLYRLSQRMQIYIRQSSTPAFQRTCSLPISR